MVSLTDDKIISIFSKDSYEIKKGDSYTEALHTRKSIMRTSFDLVETLNAKRLIGQFSKRLAPLSFDFDIFITSPRRFKMTILPIKNRKEKYFALFLVKSLDNDVDLETLTEEHYNDDFRNVTRRRLLESNFITAGELDLSSWKVNFLIKPIHTLKNQTDLSTMVFEFAKHFGERTEFHKFNEFFSYSNIRKKLSKADEINEVFIRRTENSLLKRYSRWSISRSETDRNILIITETDITNEIEAEHHKMLANNYHQALLSDALIVFNTNITKDIVSEDIYYTIDDIQNPLLPLLGLSLPVSYTALLEKAETFLRTDAVEEVHNMLNIRNLRKIFRFGQQEINLEYEVSVNEKVLWLNHTVLMTKNPESDEISAVTIIKDITQAHLKEETHKRKLNEALKTAEAANKAKTDFLSNLSHDIRTPMNAIYGLTTVAKEYTGDKDKMDDYIEKISVASNHLLTLVNNVLDISRIESGKILIAQEPFRMENLLTAINTIVAPQTKAKNITFTTKSTIKTNKVIGDELRMNLILINILGNAVKFTPDNGAIDFTVTEELEDNICNFTFVIRDTGIGMSEDFISKIFMPFTRDETQTRAIEGSGLGMNITKNLIDIMGGEIFVKSELGKGSEFTVKIPVTKAQDSTNGPQDGKEIPDFSNRRILIAEDNNLNMEVISRFLEKANCTFDKAENGRKALDIFIEKGDNYYDLILMDMEMPLMNGIEVVKEIRKIESSYAKEIPVVAMTGNIYEEDKQRAYAAGMTNYITKPIARDKLYEKIWTSLPVNDKNQHSENVEPEVKDEENSKNTEKKEPVKTKSIAENYDFSKIKVLAVDDNKMNLDIIKLMLSKTGANITEATNGQEAVDLYRASNDGDFSIILMDISMPVMNGYEATTEIRNSGRLDSNIPIIAISANAFPEDIEQSESKGINFHISKPIIMKKLLDKIAELVM
ncbi:MAG: response regulator [Treponema sp.]|nr:response regulator [Treponema sp.]